jgi:hypothetical protein
MKKIFYILVLLLFSNAAFANPDAYGIIDYSRAVYWPKDDVFERWVIDLKPKGDTLGGLGDFEVWAGSHASCSDCPNGWTCTCAGTSDILSETAELYKNNTSMEMQDGDSSAIASYTLTFEANKAYQIHFYYKGDTGGQEDFTITIRNAGSTDYYVFTTDSWQAGATNQTYTDITDDWTSSTIYVRTGTNTKTDYLVVLETTSADDTIYIDNFFINELRSTDLVGESGYVLLNDDESNPFFGNSFEGFFRTRDTIPNNSGSIFDSTLNDDVFERVDDDTFDFTGDFTYGCRVVPSEEGANNSIVSKWNSNGNQRSIWILQGTTDLSTFISDNGTSATNVSVASSFVAGALTSFVYSYDYITDVGNNNIINLYVNAIPVASTVFAEGPQFNTTANFMIGAVNRNNSFGGSLLECVIWSKPLSAIEANKYINPYFPATNHGDGFYMTACDQAVPYSVCSLDRCRNGIARGCQPEGTGAMSVFVSEILYIDNNSFETISSGTDANPDFADWTETETVGDGTAAITAYRNDPMHGNIAARVRLTGTTSSASLDSECQTAQIGFNMFAYVKAKAFEDAVYTTKGDFKAEGSWNGSTSSYLIRLLFDNSNFSIQLLEYDALGCITLLETNTLYSESAITDILVDTVFLARTVIKEPWAHTASGDGTTSYSRKKITMNNPISNYIESEEAFGFTDGYCISMWVSNPFPGDNDHFSSNYLAQIPGTAGNNNRMNLFVSSRKLQYWVYDSAGGSSWVTSDVFTSTTWPADTWIYVEACTDNTGNFKAHWFNTGNSTWYDLGAPLGAGTAIQTDQSNIFYLGNANGSSLFDGFIRSVCIVNYEEIYPNCLFGDVPKTPAVL